MTPTHVLPDADLVTSAQLVVSGEQLAAYRSVVRSCTPAFSAGVDGRSMPSPIHPFVLAWKTFDQAVGVLTGCSSPTVVHLSQEIHLARPIRAGERVGLKLEVLGARRDPMGVRLSFLSTMFDEGRDRIAELMTGLLAMGVSEPEPFGAPRRHPVSNPTGTPASCTHTIPLEFPRRYAQVSADANPIHLDDEAARAAGLPGVVAHGMSVVALVTEEAIERYAGGDAARIASVGTRFSSPVVPGEPFDITFQAEAGRHRVHFRCRTAAGLALKNGWIDVRP
jgi:acyl dehydratase